MAEIKYFESPCPKCGKIVYMERLGCEWIDNVLQMEIKISNYAEHEECFSMSQLNGFSISGNLMVRDLMAMTKDQEPEQTAPANVTATASTTK